MSAISAEMRRTDQHWQEQQQSQQQQQPGRKRIEVTGLLCSFCPQVFAFRSLLLRHERKHTDQAEIPAASEPRGPVDATSPSGARATNSSNSNSVDGTPVAVSEESIVASVSGDTGIPLLAIKQEPSEEHENAQFEDPKEEQLPTSPQAEEDDAELDDHLTNCFVCGEPFGANHLLRRAAYHAEHRLCYTCHLCPLRFGKLYLLKRHLKQHSTSH